MLNVRPTSLFPPSYGKMNIINPYIYGGSAPPASSFPVIENWTMTSQSSGGTVTATAPPGISSGNLLILICTADDISGGNDTFNAVPSGWSDLGGAGDNNSGQVRVFYKVATGSESDVTITLDASTESIVWYLRVSGVDQDAPIDTASFENLSGSSFDISGVTTGVDNCLVIYALGFNGGDGSPFSVSGSGWTEEDDQAVNTGFGLGATWGSKQKATAAPVVNASITASANDSCGACMFSIRPTASASVFSAANGIYSLESIGGWNGNVCRVRRESDNAVQDFTSAELTDGTLAAFCGASVGEVRTLYDQSGSGNDIEQTGLNQPIVYDGSVVVTRQGKLALDLSSSDGLAASAELTVGSAYLLAEFNLISTNYGFLSRSSGFSDDDIFFRNSLVSFDGNLSKQGKYAEDDGAFSAVGENASASIAAGDQFLLACIYDGVTISVDNFLSARSGVVALDGYAWAIVTYPDDQSGNHISIREAINAVFER